MLVHPKPERHAAVSDMLAHFEDTFDYTTGWDGCHEDWYVDGEMTSWRRIQHPVVGEVTYKFVEDGRHSCCCVRLGEQNAIIYTRAEYDAVLASFERVGAFAEWCACSD
jgi:hypothetical protein